MLLTAAASLASASPKTLTPQVRALLGVLYEVALRQEEITYNTYTFATDVSISFITQVKELGLPGVSIVTSTNRVYNTTSAAHVLGRIGLISAEEWPTYQALNYPMNAYVGKDGVELAFESSHFALVIHLLLSMLSHLAATSHLVGLSLPFGQHFIGQSLTDDTFMILRAGKDNLRKALDAWTLFKHAFGLRINALKSPLVS